MLEWLLGLAAVGWFVYAVQREKNRPRQRQIHCQIEFIDQGDHLDLVVHNGYGVEITANFKWLVARGVKSDGPLPTTCVVPGWESTSVATLKKAAPNPLYSVDWEWVWGSVKARHDPQAVYLLPFPAGRSFAVSQGPRGTFTHKGESENAVDFDMPVGTPVLAARAGVVVDIERDFRTKVLNREAGGNYVLVRHDDGTVAEYFHLKMNGVVVEPGTEVAAGDLLGYSGNTGCSAGPHLHLMVFRARDGSQRESLPMRFLVAGDPHPQELQTGKTYTALEAE